MEEWNKRNATRRIGVGPAIEAIKVFNIFKFHVQEALRQLVDSNHYQSFHGPSIMRTMQLALRLDSIFVRTEIGLG
jgi:hypothetical protein